MDHEAVVRQKMTEKYLLNELDPVERNEFEEHFFDCPECAQDISAASEFVAQSKLVLAEKSEPVPVRVMPPKPNPAAWLGWFRPAVLVPALALLLAAIGYQSMVVIPKLQTELQQPQVLPWAPVNVATYGEGGASITAPAGKDFLLFVRIPPDGTYARYTADLYNPGGKLECSLTIPAETGQDQWPVRIPGANRAAGSYTLAVRGVTTSGVSKEIGKASFELQLQK